MPWPGFDADHVMVTSAQMKSIEGEIFSNGLPVEVLMEKVGLLMTAWLNKTPYLLDRGVVVLVGPGHNGGDGLVVARELFLKGIKVRIWCPLPISKHLTAKHFSYATWLGIEILKDTPDVFEESLWIEALFGLGQSRPLPNLIAKVLRDRQQNQPERLISLDVPAGICSDTGKPFQAEAAKASFTLTAGLIKQGLIQDRALPYVGKLVRLDLDIPEKLIKNIPETQPLRISSLDLKKIPLPRTSPVANKYERGRILIVAGSEKYRGAAWLALKGAIASGVGSIKTALPKIVADDLWHIFPEVVLSSELNCSLTGSSIIGPFLLKEDLCRFDALLIGPGLGKGDEDWDSFSESLISFKGLLVLDADGINQIARLEEGWKWILKREGSTWITPHCAEFKRLFPHLDLDDPLRAASKAARESGAEILLKGAHSVIASSEGRIFQLAETSPSVARTGLGDLLAGFATGLGALEFANKKRISAELFAAAAFMHAEAARISEKGSSASAVAISLENLVRRLQLEMYL